MGQAVGHPRALARARQQVSLGHELCVGLDHDPARDPELARQQTGRRQPRAAPQPARADAVAQLALDLRAQGAVAVQGDVQIHGERSYGEGYGARPWFT